jgi:DNA-binding NtrC family response regulator
MKVSILYVGTNAEINTVMHRLLNSHEGWEGDVADSVENAIERVHRVPFDVVLFGNGIADEDERKLRAILKLHDPEIITIEHYGGGSGLLENEVRSALDERAARNKPSVSVRDGLF